MVVQTSQRQPEPAVLVASLSSSSLGSLASLFLAAETGFQPSTSSSSTSGMTISVASSAHSTSTPGRIDWLSFEQQCHFLLAQGLADSTWRSYTSGQRKFVNFCTQIGQLHPSGSLCHTNKWTSCLLPLSWMDQFTTLLPKITSQQSILYILRKASQTLWSTVSVYSGSFKTQGSREAQRAPITNNILMILCRSLHLSNIALFPCLHSLI